MNPSSSEPHTPYERTTCACDQCRACCKRQPGPLIPGDMERIAGYICRTQQIPYEIALEQVKAQLWASPGSLLKDLADGRTYRIGTITPRYRRGRCVFLDENERCRIHPVAPFGCSHFDTHMSAQRAHTRSLWAIRQQQRPDYQQLRDTLPYATHHKPLKYDL